MLRSRGLALLVAAAVVALLAVVAVIWLLPGADEPVARNVILINGDGMARAQREAATLAQEGFGGALDMDQLAVSGSQRTDPHDPDAVVTDSAAAASAWATGMKTSNGRISTSPEGQRLTPLGRQAAQAGKATGIVTTSTVTDASPAAFFSSVPRREQQASIAAQYVNASRPNVVLGGGAFAWSDDLLDEAARSGYDVLTDSADLEGATGSRLLGLFAEQEMWRAANEGDGAEYDPAVSLAEMTAKALEVLSRDEDGFFLFVEEEAIDGMGHANNGTLLLESMLVLDAAVEVAREYIAEHPDTLLVVTGDHESGGMSIEDFDEGNEDGPFDVAGSERQFALDWSTGSHTGVPTPVTAEGPGSERLAGIYPNTHLYGVLRDALLGS